MTIAAALVAVAPLAAAAAPASSAVKTDWTKTVAATPEGGFRMGNPQAKVRLIEYGSLTCPHCRDFSAAAMTPLRAHIKTGRVSFEYRNFVLNGIDVAATLVARCGGASRYFPVMEALYAAQSSWTGKITALPDAEREKLQQLPPGQRLARLAEIGGMLTIAARHGVQPARAKACLADSAALERLGKMAEDANATGVTGTPTFFINGARADASDWASLEPLLKRGGS